MRTQQGIIGKQHDRHIHASRCFRLSRKIRFRVRPAMLLVPESFGCPCPFGGRESRRSHMAIFRWLQRRAKEWRRIGNQPLDGGNKKRPPSHTIPSVHRSSSLLRRQAASECVRPCSWYLRVSVALAPSVDANHAPLSHGFLPQIISHYIFLIKTSVNKKIIILLVK